MFKRVTIALTFVLLLTFEANAQRTDNYKYEIGLKLLSYSELVPIKGTSYNNSAYYSSYPRGIIFKTHDNQFSYRFSFNYRNYKRYGSDTLSNKYKDLSVRTGFEKDFIYSEIRPYIGFELFYYRSDFKGSFENPSFQNSTLINARNGIGFSPIIGIKYSPIDRLTISVESNVEGIWAFDKQKVYTTNSNMTTTLPSNDHFEVYFNPLAMFTVSYSF